jgi:hypothetical protein
LQFPRILIMLNVAKMAGFIGSDCPSAVLTECKKLPFIRGCVADCDERWRPHGLLVSRTMLWRFPGAFVIENQ